MVPMVFFSFSFAIVFVAVIAACHGRPGLDSDSGSESNEHNEFGCFIVPDGTTKCPAPTGISCNDRAYLAVSLQKALTNKSSVTRWHNIFRYLTIWNNKYLAIVCSSFQKLSKRYQIVQNS